MVWTFIGHLVLNLGPAIGDLYVVEGKFQQRRGCSRRRGRFCLGLLWRDKVGEIEGIVLDPHRPDKQTVKF